MALQPDEAELLRNIYREVGETKVAVQNLTGRVDAHLQDDALVHSAHAADLSDLQGDQKANVLKQRFAIVLGMGGLTAGGSTWWQSFLDIFHG
jgi:hypothetical protein